MRHQMETDANCTIVNVTGFGKAVSIDFEEVFVSADVMYHAMQRAWMKIRSQSWSAWLHRHVQ
jgi:hypothetical protein